MKYTAGSILAFAVGVLLGYISAPAGISHQDWTRAQAESDARAKLAGEEAAMRTVWTWLKARAVKPGTVELIPAMAQQVMLVRGQYSDQTPDGAVERSRIGLLQTRLRERPSASCSRNVEHR